MRVEPGVERPAVDDAAVAAQGERLALVGDPEGHPLGVADPGQHLQRQLLHLLQVEGAEDLEGVVEPLVEVDDREERLVAGHGRWVSPV